MVDRQTPAVKSDDETMRQAEAVREVTDERDADAGRRATDDQARAEAADATRTSGEGEADVDARKEASVRRDIDRELQSNAALFDPEAAKDFQERWLIIQTEFVDEPGAAVKKAEALVAEVVNQLTEGFARERQNLEGRWSGSDDVSTEDLRQAIRRYRSFFNRLLAL